VLQIIQEQELSVSSSQSQESRFYVVARTNFPKGLTLEQQKWLVTKQELESRYELRDDNTDYEQMYVFHDACPRAGLGKWANTLRLSLKMSRTSREPRPAASSHSLTAAGEANRASSTENDGAESSEPVPPADKKRRLKKMVSTTSSDEEDKTLEEIIVQVNKAAEAGRIYSPDATNTHTVHFWANAVATALKKKMDEKDNLGTFTAVPELFGKVLTKMLLNSGCYEHLPHFTRVFNTLEYKGVAFPR
jgi:hypothetical protein